MTIATKRNKKLKKGQQQQQEMEVQVVGNSQIAAANIPKPIDDARPHGQLQIDISEGRKFLFNFLRSTAAGAAIGSLVGTGVGLIKRKDFNGSLAEGKSVAKTFAILFGVRSHVLHAMKRLRGKDDAINAGVAGCIAGLAVMGPGSPLLRTCVTFGTFSSIIEGVTKEPDAIARLSRFIKDPQSILSQFSFPTLPPFTLPPRLFEDKSALNQPKERKSRKKRRS
uniref:TSA: Wollemia nobilis Ref_Wollemi_Transcript_3025_984 transcribed RNA sequence n=1 Tax=Wollemia nobilis TaxID=56998 RepID=A0A0C9S8W8_9CONI